MISEHYYIVPFNATQAAKGRTSNLHVVINDMNSSNTIV